jgi:hypothetical protein
MLQRGTLSAGRVAVDRTQSDLQTYSGQIMAGRWRQRVSRAFPMPKSFRDFARYLLAMSIIAAFAFLHIWTAMKITETKMELQQIRSGHIRLQRENAEMLWQLSQYTNLDQLYNRAANLGFRETVTRRYIRTAESFYPASSLPTDPAGQEPGDPDLLQSQVPAMVRVDPITSSVQAWAVDLQTVVQNWWSQFRSELVQHWQSLMNNG